MWILEPASNQHHVNSGNSFKPTSSQFRNKLQINLIWILKPASKQPHSNSGTIFISTLSEFCNQLHQAYIIGTPPATAERSLQSRYPVVQRHSWQDQKPVKAWRNDRSWHPCLLTGSSSELPLCTNSGNPADPFYIFFTSPRWPQQNCLLWDD